MRPIFCALLLSALVVTTATRADPVADPLNSGHFDAMADWFFEGKPYVFDSARVLVTAPVDAEDPLNLPMTVDARALDGVEKLVLFADSNPLPLIGYYYPTRAEPYLSLRIKVDQAGPVRAAALTADGVWHVGGTFVNAAGGGCSLPATVHANSDWPDHLGEVQARAWPQSAEVQRVRARFYHPMDTGLADGIPAFFIEDLRFLAEDGSELARLQPFEPVSEHPMFTVQLKPDSTNQAIRIEGRDIEANEITAEVPLFWRNNAVIPTSVAAVR